MIVHKDLQQQTPEWFEIRALKMTASHAQAIASNGKGLDTYIDELVSEYYSTAQKEMYSNKDMERGNELEPLARFMYGLENKVEIEEVGFIENDEHSGCSPDGLVGEDGGVEIKALSDIVYFRHLKNGPEEIDTKYIWQIQMNLLITGRKWWDFVAYNPNYKKSLFIHRIYPDPVAHAKLLAGLQAGTQMIKKNCEIMDNLK